MQSDNKTAYFETTDAQKSVAQNNSAPFSNGNGTDDVQALTPGVVLKDRYVIQRIEGVGGFGITYLAWDMTLETYVAAKEYYPHGIAGRNAQNNSIFSTRTLNNEDLVEGRERFLYEARSTAKFATSEHIVNVTDYFEENNTAYIIMEYINGLSLTNYLNALGRMLTPEESLNIIYALCDAVKTVHEAGIIHRDLSPGNILIREDGVLKLIDFGAARFDENDVIARFVKPGFSPVEQYANPDEQGPWTDIYALGATYYYMLTGKRPTDAKKREKFDELLSPDVLNPAIPTYIGSTIMKAMAVDPDFRFRSVAEFEQALLSQYTLRNQTAVCACCKKQGAVENSSGIVEFFNMKDGWICTKCNARLPFIMRTNELSVGAAAKFLRLLDENVSEAQRSLLSIQSGRPENIRVDFGRNYIRVGSEIFPTKGMSLAFIDMLPVDFMGGALRGQLLLVMRYPSLGLELCEPIGDIFQTRAHPVNGTIPKNIYKQAADMSRDKSAQRMSRLVWKLAGGKYFETSFQPGDIAHFITRALQVFDGDFSFAINDKFSSGGKSLMERNNAFKNSGLFWALEGDKKS